MNKFLFLYLFPGSIKIHCRSIQFTTDGSQNCTFYFHNPSSKNSSFYLIKFNTSISQAQITIQPTGKIVNVYCV